MDTANRIWQDIRSGKNLDIYTALIVIFAVVGLDIFGVVDQSIVSSAILAVLALVATNVLSSRKDSEIIQSQLSTLTSGSHSTQKFLEQEFSLTELHSLVSDSQEFLLIGPVFTTAIPLLAPSIEEALKKGTDLKFLFAKPFGHAIKMFTLSDHYGGNRSEAEASLSQTIMGHIKLLDNMQKKTHSGKLQVKVIDYLPSFALYAFDSHQPSGKMAVRPLPPFRGLTKKRPSFILNRSDELEWHDYFVKQSELLWEAGEFIDIDNFKKE